MEEILYKGMLNYLNGTRRLISIPGAENKDGMIYVPENIEIEGKLFLLNNKGHTEEWFSYMEVEKKEKPLAKVIPFKTYLH